MPEPRDYARRLVKGSAIIFVALVAAGLVGILLRMFLLRSLSVVDYGLFYSAFYFVLFISLFRDLGLNLSLTKHVPEFMLKRKFGEIKSSMATVALLQTLFALPITLFLLVFSDHMALAITGSINASIVFKILGLWFLAMVFFHIFRSAFQGFQDPVTYAGMEVFYILSTFLLVFFAVGIFNLGIEGIALAFLSSAAVVVVVWMVIFRKKYHQVLKEKILIKKPLAKKLLKFALPVFIGSIGGVILAYTDTVMLSIIRGPAEAAYYQAAHPLADLVYYFPAALGIVLLPIAAELWARRKEELLSRTLHFLVKFSFMFIIPVVFVFIAFPDTVLLSFTGRPEYLAGALTLQILTVATISGTIFAILQCVAAGIGKPIITTEVVGTMASVNFVGNLLVIPRYGIQGAAVTTFISSLLGLILTLYLLRKFVKFTLPIRSLFRTLIAGLYTLLLILGLKSVIVLSPWWLEAIVVVIPSLLFYVVLVLAVRAISRQDLELLKGVVPIPKRLVRIMERVTRE